MNIAEEICPRCGEKLGETGGFDDNGEIHCIDCWSGYDLCKACEDYRCEHVELNEVDLKDPDFYSCHCENEGCKTGFVEGSTNRIVNRAEWKAIKASWEKKEVVV